MRFIVDYMDTEEKRRTDIVNVVHIKFIPIAIRSRDRKFREIISYRQEETADAKSSNRIINRARLQSGSFA